VALPGETLSRHRERSAEHTEPSATEPEQETASELHAVSSGHAAIDTAFPPAQAEEPAPLVLEEEEMEDAEEESEKPESELDVYEEGQSDTQRLSSKRLRRSGRVIIEEPPSKRGRWSKGFTSRWAASNKGPL